MRPVNSMIEFKQIIGRGTRLYDGKDYFTIHDFVKAHQHFSDPEWDGEPLEPEVCVRCNHQPCVCAREPLPCRECGKQPCECAKERSEEHTSELQSLMRISYAVFCLKKKKKITNNHIKTAIHKQILMNNV